MYKILKFLRISVSNSETSGNSNLRSTNQTSDTDSNALTTSSKITKTDDEVINRLPLINLFN